MKKLVYNFATLREKMGISLKTCIESKDFDNPDLILELLNSAKASVTFFGKKIIILKDCRGSYRLAALAKKILQAIFNFCDTPNTPERNIPLWNQTLGRLRLLDETSTTIATNRCCRSCFTNLRDPSSKKKLPVHSLTLAKNCLITPQKEILYIYTQPLSHGSLEKVATFLDGPLENYCNN